jgi:hypothetical protein
MGTAGKTGIRGKSLNTRFHSYQSNGLFKGFNFKTSFLSKISPHYNSQQKQTYTFL